MFPLSSKPFTILLFLTVTLASVNKVTGTDLLDYVLGWFDDSSEEEDYSDEVVENGSFNVTCKNCTVYLNVNNNTNLNTPGIPMNSTGGTQPSTGVFMGIPNVGAQPTTTTMGTQPITGNQPNVDGTPVNTSGTQTNTGGVITPNAMAMATNTGGQPVISMGNQPNIMELPGNMEGMPMNTGDNTNAMGTNMDGQTMGSQTNTMEVPGNNMGETQNNADGT